MVLEVSKKDRETSQNLAHRFTRTVRQSGVILELRKKKYHKRAKSALTKKRSAIRRVEKKAEKIKEAKMSKPK